MNTSYILFKSFESVIFPHKRHYNYKRKCSATEQIHNGEPFLHSLEKTLALYPPLTTIYKNYTRCKLHLAWK